MSPEETVQVEVYATMRLECTNVFRVFMVVDANTIDF